MGLDISDDRRNTLQRASLLWGESTALLLLVGLTAGCTNASRQPLPPAAASEAAAKPKPTLSPLEGEVTATESAEGHTYLQLTSVPGLLEGDVIRVMAEGRVVATALITKADAHRASALVTGLSDRTRPVATGDRATRLLPAELLPTPDSPAAVRATAETAAMRATGQVAAETTASGHAPPAQAPEPEAVAPPVVAQPAEKSIQPVRIGPKREADAVGISETPVLNPEMRARLTAERAYFDLATRILRLPAAGPELEELQERLRGELAEVELLP